MLRQAQNDLLTQTGPGTPGGRFFRSYWLPVLLSEELPENDCPPVRVKVLSERLLAFRDSEGRLGLIDEFCAHRGVSLWFGRNEQAGLRCPYHGWKYDVTGQCMDVPSEPEESGFCKRIKLKSYPLDRAGRGLMDLHGAAGETAAAAGIGVRSRSRRPIASFPSASRTPTGCRRWKVASIPATSRSCIAATSIPTRCSRAPRATSTILPTSRPVFEVVESAGGLYIGARRNAENEQYYWRITQWVMPTFTMIPPRGNHSVHGHFWIPIDDENCWTWSYDYHPTRELTPAEVAAMRDGKGIHVKCIPGTFRSVANKDNDYLMDRAAQKEGRSYSGVEGFAMQDASVQESMGPIVDRTKENLVSTDNGIIMARHRLLRSIKAQTEKDETPPGVDPAHQRVRSAAVVLPRDRAFKDAAREALMAQPGTAPASV